MASKFHGSKIHEADPRVNRWSDGLGNPRENSLPECQVKEVNRLVSALYSNEQSGTDGVHVHPPTLETELGGLSLAQKKPGQRQYIWMDTLCVPVRPLDLRKAAIKTMRIVYSNAEKVLIVDSDLMQSTADTTYEAIFIRISTSTWTRRLWTLQEAVLAKTRHFQFAERAVRIDPESTLAQIRDRDLDLATNFHHELAWYCHDYDFSWQSAQSHLSPTQLIALV